jgi:hypothetical protein
MLKKIIAASLLANVYTCAIAGDAGNGKITKLYFMSNAVVLFVQTGQRISQPVCATQLQRWAINTSTDAGKAQLSGLLTAYSTGKEITIKGAGTCQNWGDSESVSYFYITDL